MNNASAGVAALLLTYPFLAALIKWVGIAYLLFIAWQLARPDVTGKELNRPDMKPLSFWQSARVSVCQSKGMDVCCGHPWNVQASDATIARTAIVVVMFSIATVTSLITWAWLGTALRSWLSVGSRTRIFNVAMGVLLAATALWLATL